MKPMPHSHSRLIFQSLTLKTRTLASPIRLKNFQTPFSPMKTHPITPAVIVFSDHPNHHPAPHRSLWHQTA